MMSYYTANTILSWMALSVLCILVWENDRLKSKNKRIFYLTYAFIAASAFSEWLGIQLNGNEQLPSWVLLAVKTADYILTPMAGGALIGQMKDRHRLYKLLLYVLAGNTLFQLIACPFGWMVTIDEHNVYTHGPLYSVYVGIYLLVIILVIAGFIMYGKTFRKHNRLSLYTIMVVVFAGIGMQEVFGSEIRTAYIALTYGAAMMFIHYSEFSQLASDDRISEQRIQITTDSLTGVQSRYAYSRALREYSQPGSLGDDLAVFMIDINGMKMVNDTLGHEAGDEMLCGAAECIGRVFGADGRIFRIGGDEFVAISRMSRAQAEDAVRRLGRVTKAWSGDKVKKLSIAAGFAVSGEHPEYSAEQLAKAADEAMYADKTEYYTRTGIERRKH